MMANEAGTVHNMQPTRAGLPLAGTVMAALGLLGLTACSQPAMPDQTDGAAFYADNCIHCHGISGRGDGAFANDLPNQPPDLTKLSAENGGTFPAARALSYIYGDPRESHLARVMPQFSTAMADDLVPVEIDGVFTPTPRVLAGLLEYLETIQVD